MMNKILLDGLKAVKEDALEYNANPQLYNDRKYGTIYTGICYSLSQYLSTLNNGREYSKLKKHFYYILEKSCIDWEHYSGDDSFPVESSVHVNPEEAYDCSDNLWVGEYGNRRFELLDRMIKCLETEIKNDN